MVFRLSGRGCDATASYDPVSGKLCVRKGSKIRQSVTSYAQTGVRERRQQLFSSNQLSPTTDGRLELLADEVFDTPSAAGGFVTGSSCNGWTEWRNQLDQPLNEVVERS